MVPDRHYLDGPADLLCFSEHLPERPAEGVGEMIGQGKRDVDQAALALADGRAMKSGECCYGQERDPSRFPSPAKDHSEFGRDRLGRHASDMSPFQQEGKRPIDRLGCSEVTWTPSPGCPPILR